MSPRLLSRAELPARVAAAPVILIAGPSCGGKSTLALELAGSFPALVVCGDDWALSEAELAAQGGALDLESPSSYRLADLAAALRALRAGASAVLPRFSFAADGVVEERPAVLAAGRKLIVEFLHAFHPEIQAAVQPGPFLRLFVDTPAPLRRQRRWERDRRARGKERARFEREWRGVEEWEAQQLGAVREQADFVVLGS